ncbi:MAG: MarR family winged helix-turn-helix transcriptional regulator [Pseudomonadota bacterium]
MSLSERPELLDHVGWRLHLAYARWKTLFAERMVARGCPWMGEARGALLQHIGADGVSQNVLVARSGLTKQAVQQHLDALVADGIVARLPDPKDARKKRVRLTAKGIEGQHIANAVKLEIEEVFAETLGPEGFAALKAALGEICAP